jgi:AraC-like DNA-binding protein
MDATWRCPPHHHDCVEIVFCEACSGVLYVGCIAAAYGAGDILVCRPGETHRVENSSSGTQFCFGLDGAGAEAIPSGVYAASPELDQIRTMLLAALAERASSHDPKIDMLCGLAAVILEQQAVGTAGLESKIDAVTELIRTRYADDWNTTTLAYHVGLSPDYLRHAFRDHMGVSVAQFLREVRLSMAVRLLESTDQPVKQIARLCGFQDPGYFSKRFRKVHGVPPDAYRSARRREADPALRFNNARVIAAGDTERVAAALHPLAVDGTTRSPEHISGRGTASDGHARKE